MICKLRMLSDPEATNSASNGCSGSKSSSSSLSVSSCSGVSGRSLRVKASKLETKLFCWEEKGSAP